MPHQICIHYEGHTTPTNLPLLPGSSLARNWWSALAHVNKFIAPHRPTFRLFDDRFSVRYRDGVPDERDLTTLVDVLRMSTTNSRPRGHARTLARPPVLAALRQLR